ncbi:MAG TPA: ATP-binding protein [Gammaproteobacteria bacterium]
MSAQKLNILYIEDDEDHMILFMDVLSSIDSFAPVVTHKASLVSGVKALEEQNFDVVILDLGLSESQGLETLSRFIVHCPYTPIVVLTTNEDIQLSVKAIKAGAQDFLVKGDMSPNTIARALRYSVERFGILNELAEKNESLNTFAIAASHDLRTPLRNIKLIIDFFDSDYADKLPPEGYKELGKIKFAVSQLYKLIESLMEFTKSETKLSAARLFSSAACIEDALRLIAADIEQAKAKISVADNLPQVYGNSNLIIRVFQNLINNALKYVDSRTPEILIGAKEEADEFIFYITDNGIGIEEKYFLKIFEPLKRLHTQQKYPGSGIGLAICNRIVAAHGGRIWVESKPGQGSTFYFTLPKNQELANTG